MRIKVLPTFGCDSEWHSRAVLLKAAEGRRSPRRSRESRWRTNAAKRLGVRQSSGALVLTTSLNHTPGVRSSENAGIFKLYKKSCALVFLISADRMSAALCSGHAFLLALLLRTRRRLMLPAWQTKYLTHDPTQNRFLHVQPIFRFVKNGLGVRLKSFVINFLAAIGWKTMHHQRIRFG